MAVIALTRRPNDAYAAEAADARVRFLGGPSIRNASVFRFCTMAARWNSSCAGEVPKPHAPEAALQMREPHLDALSVIS